MEAAVIMGVILGILFLTVTTATGRMEETKALAERCAAELREQTSDGSWLYPVQSLQDRTE